MKGIGETLLCDAPMRPRGQVSEMKPIALDEITDLHGDGGVRCVLTGDHSIREQP
jgi:hypothetical protein